MAVDGRHRLFWPEDLEEISSAQTPARWRWLVEKEGSRALVMGEHLFPLSSYYLDESDPNVAILRRQDDPFVSAFSARCATRDSIVEAAKEDYRELVRAHANSLGPESEERFSS